MKRTFLTHVWIITVTLAIFSACSENSGTQQSSAEKSPESSQSGILAYTPHEAWARQTPSTRMRKDEYILPAHDSENDAELTVAHFPGMGGGVGANIERWRKQFEKEDGAVVADTAKIVVNEIPVTLVYLEGVYLKSQNPAMMQGPKDRMPDYALMAAIAETGQGPWFFKAIGPRETIRNWRPAFEIFAQSFRLE